MGYTGGKAGSGVYQQIINQIPPHTTRSYGLELDPKVIQASIAEYGDTGLYRSRIYSFTLPLAVARGDLAHCRIGQCKE